VGWSVLLLFGQISRAAFSAYIVTIFTSISYRLLQVFLGVFLNFCFLICLSVPAAKSGTWIRDLPGYGHEQLWVENCSELWGPWWEWHLFFFNLWKVSAANLWN